jgi:hypothetical protein
VSAAAGGGDGAADAPAIPGNGAAALPPPQQQQQQPPQQQQSSLSRSSSSRSRPGGARDPAPGFAVAPPLDCLDEVDHGGPSSLVLRMRLARQRAGNTLVLKLIAPEDLMDLHGDTHEDGPNVDVLYVAARGWGVCLPAGIKAL